MSAGQLEVFARPLPARLRSAPARIIVADTSALIRDIRYGAKRGQLTDLLASLEIGSARVYVTARVLSEIDRVSQEEWASAGAPDGAVADRWKSRYRPRLHVVDVDPTWGRALDNVNGVLRQDPDDVDTARLVAALAPCGMVVDDTDLISHGFGGKDWPLLTRVAGNQAAVDHVVTTVYVPSRLAVDLSALAVQSLWKLPTWVKIALLLALCGGLEWYAQDGRARRQLVDAGHVLADMYGSVEPYLALLAQRTTEGNKRWSDDQVVLRADRTRSERIASVLARSEVPMLAGDIARALEDDEMSVRALTSQVRQELDLRNAFVEGPRWRWQLGYQEGAPSPLSAPTVLAEHIDWWIRLLAPVRNPAPA